MDRIKPVIIYWNSIETCSPEPEFSLINYIKVDVKYKHLRGTLGTDSFAWIKYNLGFLPIILCIIFCNSSAYDLYVIDI